MRIAQLRARTGTFDGADLGKAALTDGAGFGGALDGLIQSLLGSDMVNIKRVNWEAPRQGSRHTRTVARNVSRDDAGFRQT